MYVYVHTCMYMYIRQHNDMHSIHVLYTYTYKYLYLK